MNHAAHDGVCRVSPLTLLCGTAGNMDFGVIDECVKITDDESFSTCHALAQSQGIMIGGSAGMNVCAAIKVAEAAPAGSVVVTVLCDNGVK
eukprot:SAG31_NODE_1376_length_8593_cov_23.146927_5_plen_91_part_00